MVLRFLQVAWFSFAVSRSSCSFHGRTVCRDWTRNCVSKYCWSIHHLCFTSTLSTTLHHVALCSVSFTFNLFDFYQLHSHRSIVLNVVGHYCSTGCLSGVTVRASDFRSSGCEFDSRSGGYQAT